MKDIIKCLLKQMLMIMPTNKSWIVFESHSDFCDNSRALFEYMYKEEMYKKYKFIWLVDDKEKFKNTTYKNTIFLNIEPKKFIDKIKLYWYSWGSKYRFLSHRIIAGYSKYQITVNLWHGTLLKSIKGNAPIGKHFDYILTPSYYYKDIYTNQFECDEKQLLYLGYPRNDMLFDNSNNIKKLTSSNPKKFIMWMPTYRKNKRGSARDSNIDMTYGVPIIETKDQLLEIQELLKNIDVYLLIKVHPAQDITMLEEIKLDNIMIITNNKLDEKGINLYSLVGETSALITDYSSIYFDYLLLDKPIGFTITDKEEYSNNRGYVFNNPLDMMPGEHINDINELKEFIKNIEIVDLYKKDRNRINKRVNKYIDGDSCRRIVEFLNL